MLAMATGPSLIPSVCCAPLAQHPSYGPSGSADVMGHPFFKQIDWRKLEGRQASLRRRPALLAACAAWGTAG